MSRLLALFVSLTWMRIPCLAIAIVFLSLTVALADQIHVIYTSDQHYGITRKSFRQQNDVSATEVNLAMVHAINSLPEVSFPHDNGVLAGQRITWADSIISTGDIANRMEGEGAPSAAECWQIFEHQYTEDLILRDRSGQKPELLVIPGNHDATNAVGFHRAMFPATDNSAMVAMYNRTGQAQRTCDDFDFHRDKVFLSRNLGGVQIMLVQMWPDSLGRQWLASQLDALPAHTPVLLFTHDQPDIEAKHLVNPHGDGSINGEHKFENLVADTASIGSVKEIPLAEHRALADFIASQPAIKAYFHGNDNHTEFYDWQGPDHTINLPVFRIDSPMKGNESAKDETRLSFQSVSIDTSSMLMTVREVLWNADPINPCITWGQSRTISLLYK